VYLNLKSFETRYYLNKLDNWDMFDLDSNRSMFEYTTHKRYDYKRFVCCTWSRYI